jgi:glycosyltransferase involved in cell wall biosynthesis
MRIVVALHDYLPLHTGGSEVHAHQSAAELARRGHEVTALFTERDLERAPGDVRRGELDGVRTVEVVHQREYADLRETWEERPSLDAFRARMEELRPDVVHFHHLAFWGSGAIRAARDAGARVVVTVHDYHPLCDAGTLLRPDGELCALATAADARDVDCTACIRRHPVLPERWGLAPDASVDDDLWTRAVRERTEQHRRDLAAAHRVISPSHFLARRLAAAGFVPEEDIVVLKAGYPGPLHAPRTRTGSDGPLRVGYVGGLYHTKGVHVVVRAFRHLDGVPAELHVHGHLDWFPEYVAALRADAEGRPVHLHGPFDPPRIDAILAGVDVLVVPSVWVENMPITIQEAYRNGLPVIATELGGMAEAVTDGESGLTFPRGDDAALAAAIRRLTNDPALYDRLARGRPPVPTLPEIVDELEGIYAG